MTSLPLASTSVARRLSRDSASFSHCTIEIHGCFHSIGCCGGVYIQGANDAMPEAQQGSLSWLLMASAPGVCSVLMVPFQAPRVGLS